MGHDFDEVIEFRRWKKQKKIGYRMKLQAIEIRQIVNITMV